MTADGPAGESSSSGGGGGILARMANEVLLSAERVTNQLESSMESLFNTAATDTNEQAGHSDTYSSPVMDHPSVDYEQMVREQLDGSPLQDMADSVLGNIIQNQVGIII
jgi:hypothetical protein